MNVDADHERDVAERLATHFGELVKLGHGQAALLPIDGFLHEVSPTVEQFRQLCRAMDFGYTVVLSLDLCDLLDTAYTFRQRQRQVQSLELLEQRRVLTNIGYSREAMGVISKANFPFTILPGTAAEILNYLQHAYVKNQVFVKTLKKHRLRIEYEEAENVLEKTDETMRSFQNLLSSGMAGLAATNRLVSFVSRLIEAKGFVPAPRSPVRGEDAEFDRFYENILTALNAVRPSGGLNNRVDASNLSTAASSPPGPDGRIFVHMTRTPSLHRLGDRKVELGVHLEAKLKEGPTVPILVGPQLPCLFHAFFRGGRWQERDAAKAIHAQAEDFVARWSAVAGALRTYEQALLKRQSADVVRRQVEKISQLLERPDARTFDVGMRKLGELFGRNAAYVEQILCEDFDGSTISDLDDQLSEMKRQPVLHGAMRLEQKLRELDRLIRRHVGLDRARTVVMSVPDKIPREGRGLHWGMPVHAVQGNGAGVSDYRLTETELSERTYLGVQSFEEDGVEKRTVFWTPYDSQLPFLQHIVDFAQEVGRDDELRVISVGDGGSLAATRYAGVKSVTAENILRDLETKPARIVQAIVGDWIFTYEVNVDGREAFVSVCYPTNGETRAAEAVYETTSGVLPAECVREFIERFGK